MFKNDLFATDNLFIPNNFKLVWFFGANNFQAYPLATEISEKLGCLFKVDPSVNSFPPGMPIPGAVPRITIQNQDVQAMISSEIADLTFSCKNNDTLVDQLSSYVEKFASCIDSQKIPVVKVGFVCICKIKDNCSIESIREKYIHPHKMKMAPEFNVGWLDKINFEDYELNKWVRFACTNNKELRGTLVIDVNTDIKLNSQRFYKAKDAKKIVEHFLDSYRSDLNGVLNWSD